MRSWLASGLVVAMVAGGCTAGTRSSSSADPDAGTPVDAAAVADLPPEVSTTTDAARDLPVFDFEVGAPTDAASVDAPCNHELRPTIRDFRGYSAASGARHPDFEAANVTSHKGIIQPMLGADQKPIYAPPGATPATTSKVNFDQWYRDVDGVNQRFDDVVLPLTQDPARPEVFVFDDQTFFPINGRGWNECQFCGDNFHFTTEIHLQFPYRGGETFTFRGDDDSVSLHQRPPRHRPRRRPPPPRRRPSISTRAHRSWASPGTELPDGHLPRRAPHHFSNFRIETTIQCVTVIIVD